MNNLLSKWKRGLDRTRKITFGRLASALGASEINDESWEELEAILIQADIGMETTLSIIESLQQQAKEEGYTKSEELQVCLRHDLIQRLEISPPLEFNTSGPTVLMIVGVNGSGKIRKDFP